MRRMLTHFNQTSLELCKSIANLSYKKASKFLLHENQTAHNLVCLIPLDKSPGVKSISICKILRQIIGKTFHRCLEQKCGIEYAIQCLRNEFEKPEMGAKLHFDARHAFICSKNCRSPLSGTTIYAGQLI